MKLILQTTESLIYPQTNRMLPQTLEICLFYFSNTTYMRYLQQTLVDMRYLTFKTQMNLYNQIKQYVTNVILSRFVEHLNHYSQIQLFQQNCHVKS